MDARMLALALTVFVAMTTTISCQQIATCYGQLDLVFMVDASNSVQGVNFATQMNTLAVLTNRLDVAPTHIRVGTIVFSTTVESKPITGNKAQAVNDVRTFQYLDESTRTDLGLQEAVRLFRNARRESGIPKLLMVITDGASTEPQLTLAAARQAKAEGISIYAIGITTAVNENELRNIASSPTQVMLTPNFQNIATVLENAVRQACIAIITTPRPTTPRPTPAGFLCAQSGSIRNGIGYESHPFDCDKYIQCYYNPTSTYHLGVVRHCPLGLHWNRMTLLCEHPWNVNCTRDPCKTDCAPYPMADSFRAHWYCKDKRSKAGCCDDFETFIAGKGCVKNMKSKCMEKCMIGKCGTGHCQSRPNWNMATMYYTKLPAAYLGWYPRTCSYNNFGIVECKCAIKTDHICNPDFETTLVNGAPMAPYVTASNVNFANNPGMLAQGGLLHIDLHKKLSNEPLTIKLEYRESFQRQDSEILLASTHECALNIYGGSLLVTYNNNHIRAEIKNMYYQSAVVVLPTIGFSNRDVKTLTFNYDGYYLTMSVVVGNVQYVERSKAPPGITFPCGLDIGATAKHSGFTGFIQKLSIYSCSPAKFTMQ